MATSRAHRMLGGSIRNSGAIALARPRIGRLVLARLCRSLSNFAVADEAPKERTRISNTLFLYK